MQNEKIIELLCELVKPNVADAVPVYNTSIEIGKSYLIRTVTMMYTGRVIAITHTDFLLEDAAWIGDSGRYSNALKTGELNEVEPYPDTVSVSRAAYVDAALWKHDLPREVK